MEYWKRKWNRSAIEERKNIPKRKGRDKRKNTVDKRLKSIKEETK